MALSAQSRRRRGQRRHEVHKPAGVLHPRVEKVGPQHFGAIDYAALYWHLVDLIWIYLFPLLYLIH